MWGDVGSLLIYIQILRIEVGLSNKIRDIFIDAAVQADQYGGDFSQLRGKTDEEEDSSESDEEDSEEEEEDEDEEDEEGAAPVLTDGAGGGEGSYVFSPHTGHGVPSPHYLSMYIPRHYL